MFTLQLLPSCTAPDRSPPPPLLCCGRASSFWGTTKTTAVDFSGGSREEKKKLRLGGPTVRIVAMSSSSSNTFKMNLNEYMVTLEKPLGIRFALSVDGKIFVHALKKGGNAEKSRIVMVGDTLRKAGSSSDERLSEIKDFGDTHLWFLQEDAEGEGRIL
ncbi:hypothetical protein ACLB2K_068000 [Fragaria x ananassa]